MKDQCGSSGLEPSWFFVLSLWSKCFEETVFPPGASRHSGEEEKGAGARVLRLLINSDSEQLHSISLDCLQAAAFET